MSQRVIIYTIAWVGVLDNAGAGPILSQEWIDVTTTGSAGVAAWKATIQSPHKGVLSQYHVYFQDGGHARYKTDREFIIQEKLSGPAIPTADPSLLVPTPEFVPA
ncbi:hypothetical protein QGX11_gp136 [Pseudomonas phage PPSC2]|uniref:Uncharacterized protein n=1 Tax=Pseudomonas phage PPSC2 TaxID=2041350 RepID=A0A2R2YB79_9CAUD|nr:hypothetical protein QGX11_gp136 [Pseudomonas phage PPSC2]ATN92899.1 hypothetical protein PPSC2_136 [Pseudomonas phage PPSC2]